MKKLRLKLGPNVARDILDQSIWYTKTAGESLSRHWEQSVLETFERIQRTPLSGTPFNEFTGPLKDLRRIPVNRFPSQLVFYRVVEDEILIVRILHGARDLMALFPDSARQK